MAPSFATLTLEHPRPGVAVASLCRPARLNAMTFEMFDEFCALQQLVDGDSAARAVVLTGSGRAFCAGLDLDFAEGVAAMPAVRMLDDDHPREDGKAC